MHANRKLAPLTGIAFANNWLTVSVKVVVTPVKLSCLFFPVRIQRYRSFRLPVSRFP